MYLKYAAYLDNAVIIWFYFLGMGGKFSQFFYKAHFLKKMNSIFLTQWKLLFCIKRIWKFRLYGLNAQQKSGCVNQHICSIVSGGIENCTMNAFFPDLQETVGKVEK